MSLTAFDRVWARMRARDAELRPRIANWLKSVVPTGSSAPHAVHGQALERDDGWRCQVFLHHLSRRGSKGSPYHEFPIAPTVPEKLSKLDFQELGLAPKQRDLVPMAWLLEVLGQAWVEAGLTSPFSLGGAPFPGPRFPWTDLIRASAYRVTAPLPPSSRTLPRGEVELVAPPTTLVLPDTPAHWTACRAGEPGAVRAWADALASDAASAADLLRWVDGFADTVAHRVNQWEGRGPFWVFASAHQYWWRTGEEGTEPGAGDETAAHLAQLLASWNAYHPAIEWLLRRLQLPMVRYRGAYFANGAKGQTFEVDLETEHLAPLDATMGVIELHGEFRATDRRGD